MEQKWIQKQLPFMGIPVIEADLPYIQMMLETLENAYQPVKARTGLHKEDPIVVVEPEVIQFD